jgi:1-phosphatidylinositol phosphodiesterase
MGRPSSGCSPRFHLGQPEVVVRQSVVPALSRRAVLRSAAAVGLAGALPVALGGPAWAATASWMTALPDATPLSRLTLPGTHDTCALYGGSLAVCQRRTLAEQLAAGVRFIDIRCRHISDVFAIHHGSVFQNIFFGAGVRDVCAGFLATNPGETIVMSVKEEHTSSDITRTFEETFDWYVAQQPALWYLGDTVPTLGSVRGKVVLFRRFSAAGPKGLGAASWPDDATFDLSDPASISVQDEYDVPTLLPTDLTAKWTAVNSLIDRAAADTTNRWFVNFASGASLFAHPEAVAAQINPNLETKIAGTFAGRIGTVLMDFPTDALLTRLIALNG